MFAECALTIEGEKGDLAAILHPGREDADVGVLVVVGGPQYRVGSHRQFVHLARYLAGQGVPVMRFDVTGMGDSDGEKNRFDRLGADIGAAIDTFATHQPGLAGVVLWGLCDGASAGLIYAPGDRRVRGLVLANPWLENDRAKAKAHVTLYYRERFFNPQFWGKLLRGRLAFRSSVAAFLRAVQASLSRRTVSASVAGATTLSYQQRMLVGMTEFDGTTLIMLSGNDLTAKEFSLQLTENKQWSAAIAGSEVKIVRHDSADHTFSQRAWMEWAQVRTLEFIAQVR